jgi:hypothetical protein
MPQQPGNSQLTRCADSCSFIVMMTVDSASALTLQVHLIRPHLRVFNQKRANISGSHNHADDVVR